MAPRHWTSPAAALLTAGLLTLAGLVPAAPAQDTARPEISFTVHRIKEANVEGPDVERTYFTAAGQRIVFGLPQKCRATINDTGFLLLPEGLDGEIQVGRSTFAPDFDLPKNALAYREAAAKGNPRGAEQLEVQQPQLDPYPFNGWKSLGFTWTYAIAGRPMVRTVSYINLEVGVQVMVTTLAAKADAEKIHKIARQFMSGWWIMGR